MRGSRLVGIEGTVAATTGPAVAARRDHRRRAERSRDPYRMRRAEPGDVVSVGRSGGGADQPDRGVRSPPGSGEAPTHVAPSVSAVVNREEPPDAGSGSVRRRRVRGVSGMADRSFRSARGSDQETAPSLVGPLRGASVLRPSAGESGRGTQRATGDPLLPSVEDLSRHRPSSEDEGRSADESPMIGHRSSAVPLRMPDQGCDGKG